MYFVKKAFFCLSTLVLVAILADLPPAAAADRRVALVIGNATYPPLKLRNTAANDARLVASKLREIGFTDILEHYDVGLASMKEAVETFAIQAQGAEWAVVYYVGHGLEFNGSFYLVPADADLASESNVAAQTIILDRLLDSTAAARKLRLLILDVPRASPFGTRPYRFSLVEKQSSSGADVLISFATKSGEELPMSTGHEGPFALALVRHMGPPGADLREVFISVRDDVLKATNRRQSPFTYGSLSQAHYFTASRR
jgi:uncharacterized caspase-like protein